MKKIIFTAFLLFFILSFINPQGKDESILIGVLKKIYSVNKIAASKNDDKTFTESINDFFELYEKLSKNGKKELIIEHKYFVEIQSQVFENDFNNDDLPLKRNNGSTESATINNPEVINEVINIEFK